MFLKILFIYFVLILSVHAIDFKTSVVTLAVADVAQALSATEIKVFDFIIQNPAANTVSIFMGDAAVTTSGSNLGIEIIPGQSLTLSTGLGLFALDQIFIVSTGTAVPVVVGRINK